MPSPPIPRRPLELSSAVFTIGLCVLGLALIACTRPDRGANSEDGAGGDDRATLIAKNLELEVPQLRGSGVEVTELEPSEVPGLDRGTFTVEGRSYPFLVTNDNKRLFVLAADPIDVSRTAEEVAAALADQGAQTAREFNERAIALDAATRDLPARGRDDAPVTIVEFSDFQCPYCRRVVGTIQELLAQYPDDVRFIYAHLPLDNHEWARPAAIAAACAAAQDEDAFWMLHDFYFEEQQTLTTTNVIDRSREALAASPVDHAEWMSCAADMSSGAHGEAARSVDASAALGERYGVRGTPAFFVNGRLISGAQPLGVFVQAIEASLEAQR